MNKKDIQAAKLKMVQDAIEQVRRMGEDLPQEQEAGEEAETGGRGRGER
ncbi:hypothetical protein [Geobacter benzoatilyticus]|uniref:Uncharacterized protein n=1 Tax=Geobacter benzoatilyticus TaxID=2815309 RepID=A0ABX7Q0R7_9BACT|nr:hypothetical protein [Geobacter benzoatilyticus]QSV44994.1 hypothetical protein JZM60_12660 [Geobacter benzoatilyticus]